jgi:hypothetical protein
MKKEYGTTFPITHYIPNYYDNSRSTNICLEIDLPKTKEKENKRKYLLIRR